MSLSDDAALAFGQGTCTAAVGRRQTCNTCIFGGFQHAVVAAEASASSWTRAWHRSGWRPPARHLPKRWPPRPGIVARPSSCACTPGKSYSPAVFLLCCHSVFVILHGHVRPAVMTSRTCETRQSDAFHDRLACRSAKAGCLVGHLPAPLLGHILDAGAPLSPCTVTLLIKGPEEAPTVARTFQPAPAAA